MGPAAMAIASCTVCVSASASASASSAIASISSSSASAVGVRDGLGKCSLAHYHFKREKDSASLNRVPLSLKCSFRAKASSLQWAAKMSRSTIAAVPEKGGAHTVCNAKESQSQSGGGREFAGYQPLGGNDSDRAGASARRLTTRRTASKQQYNVPQQPETVPLWLWICLASYRTAKDALRFLWEQPGQLKFIEWPSFQSTIRMAVLTVVVVALLIVFLATIDSTFSYVLSSMLRRIL